MHHRIFAILLALGLLLAAPLALADEAGSDDPVPFPTFEAENLNGEEGGEKLTEAVFAEAEITLFNCWATWCGPCIAELPELEQLSELTGGKLQVVGLLCDAVSVQGARDDAAIETMKGMVEELGLTYPSLYPEGTLLEVSQMLRAYPTTFVIDKEGNLVTLLEGAQDIEGWLKTAQQAADQAYGEGVFVFESKE